MQRLGHTWVCPFKVIDSVFPVGHKKLGVSGLDAASY